MNGNIRVMLALLAGWAALFWWLSVSLLASIGLMGAAASRSGGMLADLWMLAVGMAMVGFVTAYITASCVLAIDRQVREMQAISKALADRAGNLTPGTFERSLFLKPSWPMPALVWSFGLHAAGAVLLSIVWLIMGFAEMR
ncbi:MAG: hypothetical protein RIB58_05730 [Phycisphaerales bacterium]